MMINESLISSMKNWQIGDHLMYCLGVDVGGSGVRFRITNFNDETQFIEHEHIKAGCSGDIYCAVNSLDQCIQKLIPESYCRGSAFAIAGLRKSKDVVCLLNWPGPDANRTIDATKFPKTLYPEHHSLLLNDLEAGAYGVISCSNQGHSTEFFEKLWGPSKPLVSATNTIVMAMGSGLGAAMITHEPIRQRPIVISTEMGYLQAAGGCDRSPGIEEEREIIQYTSNFHYGGKQMPCYEDLASGRGIVVGYQHLLNATNQKSAENQQFCPNKNLPKNSTQILNGSEKSTKSKGAQDLSGITAMEITNLAKAGDKVALEAMRRHYLFFTRCAKAVASSLKCESVVMALSNQVANRWFVRSIVPEMEAEFKSFTRPEWMERVAVWAQKKDMNFNTLGTSYMAKFAADYRL